jgi:hypothetical protein
MWNVPSVLEGRGHRNATKNPRLSNLGEIWRNAKFGLTLKKYGGKTNSLGGQSLVKGPMRRHRGK